VAWSSGLKKSSVSEFFSCMSPRRIEHRKNPANLQRIPSTGNTKKFEPGKIRAISFVQPGLPGLSGFSSRSELSRGAMLLEAIPAIYRPALGGPERHFALLLALGACRLVHFPGATKAPATPVPVSVSHVLTLFLTDIALENEVRSRRDPFGRPQRPTHLPRWSCLARNKSPTI